MSANNSIYWVFTLYTLCVHFSPSIISRGRVSKLLMRCLFTDNGTMPVPELSNLLKTAAQQWGSQHLKQGMGSSFLTVMLWNPWFFFFFFLFKLISLEYRASLVAQMVKHLSAMWETQVWPLGWEGPLEKEWQPTPVFSPGKFQGRRSLVGYSPWGCKQSDTTERLHFARVALQRCSGFHSACTGGPAFPDFFPVQVTTEHWV